MDIIGMAAYESLERLLHITLGLTLLLTSHVLHVANEWRLRDFWKKGPHLSRMVVRSAGSFGGNFIQRYLFYVHDASS